MARLREQYRSLLMSAFRTAKDPEVLKLLNKYLTDSCLPIDMAVELICSVAGIDRKYSADTVADVSKSCVILLDRLLTEIEELQDILTLEDATPAAQ